MDRVKQYETVQKEAITLFKKKNKDYGDAFAKYGVIGVLMRIEDKIQRSMSITKNGVNLIKDEKRNQVSKNSFFIDHPFFRILTFLLLRRPKNSQNKY